MRYFINWVCSTFGSLFYKCHKFLSCLIHDVFYSLSVYMIKHNFILVGKQLLKSVKVE